MIKTCTYVNSLFIIIEHMSPPKMLIVILSADNEMTINKKKSIVQYCWVHTQLSLSIEQSIQNLLISAAISFNKKLIISFFQLSNRYNGSTIFFPRNHVMMREHVLKYIETGLLKYFVVKLVNADYV